MSDRRLDASALRDWAYTAVGDLITHTDEINRLNVFPVADADTGTNMLFTMRAAWAQADALTASDDVVEVAAALARGALQGARGNSGVILSQILRGLADVTASAAADRRGVLADIGGALFGSRTAACGRPGRQPRWAKPFPAPSSRCCRMPPTQPRTRAPTTAGPRRCGGRGRRRRGGRTRQDHRATRRTGRGRRGGRRRSRAAGTAGRA